MITLSPRSIQLTARLALATLLAPVILPAEKLTTTKEMAEQTRWVVQTINSRHYLRETMETLDGAEMVEAYVESFDYGHMYFLRSELDDFVFRFADAMEDFLAKGNLYAAFQIYETYKTRAQERTDWVYERLEQDFDFTKDETFLTDRSESEWPTTQAEADALWEQRLKYELLNEMLSLAGEDKAEGFSDAKVETNIEYKDSDNSNALEVTEETKSESKEKNPSIDLGPQNPDVYAEDEDDTFDPTKIQRLLEDEAFYADILDQAREKIHRRYERNLNYTLDREAPEVQETFINSMTQLFDPHSSFLSSDTLESFNSAVQNSFVGIGAMLQDEDGICTIKELLPGGPAEASGQLEPEDEILGVAQGKDGEFEDVVDMQLRYIVRKIKGEKDTIVRLLIRPGDASDPSVRKVVSITRDEVKLTANLATAQLITVPSEDEKSQVLVGVIELPSFYGNIGAGGTLTTTTDDVSELIGKLREAGAQGIILDLRMNGGGLLSEAVRLTGLFIPVGPVVQVRDADGRVDVLSDRDIAVAWDGPLIVLTSRFSASASEIVAGALQDHNRALIVGNHSTHGKGTVQEVYNMNSRLNFSWFKIQPTPAEPETRPVASKITIKQFYLPAGSSTQVKGVISDIALPSVNEFLPIGEDDLPHALPWDSIEKADWVNDWEKLNFDAVDPEMESALLAASEKRQESLEEFQFLREQIAWRRQRFDEKEISLNLEQRIEKKISEQSYVEKLDDEYEALSDRNYPSEEYILKIAEEQEALSKRNLAERPVETADEAAPDAASVDDEEDEDPVFDIYLREGSRIMADWVHLLEEKESQLVQIEAK